MAKKVIDRDYAVEDGYAEYEFCLKCHKIFKKHILDFPTKLCNKCNRKENKNGK